MRVRQAAEDGGVDRFAEGADPVQCGVAVVGERQEFSAAVGGVDLAGEQAPQLQAVYEGRQCGLVDSGEVAESGLVDGRAIVDGQQHGVLGRCDVPDGLLPLRGVALQGAPQQVQGGAREVLGCLRRGDDGLRV